jgi:hypothetical protein
MVGCAFNKKVWYTALRVSAVGTSELERRDMFVESKRFKKSLPPYKCSVIVACIHVEREQLSARRSAK